MRNTRVLGMTVFIYGHDANIQIKIVKRENSVSSGVRFYFYPIPNLELPSCDSGARKG